MNEENRQWFEAMENLFATPGWKYLLLYITDCQSAISDQWRSCKPEDLRFVQGRFDGLDQIKTFENYIGVLKDTATEEADTDVG